MEVELWAVLFGLRDVVPLVANRVLTVMIDNTSVVGMCRRQSAKCGAHRSSWCGMDGSQGKACGVCAKPAKDPVVIGGTVVSTGACADEVVGMMDGLVDKDAAKNPVGKKVANFRSTKTPKKSGQKAVSFKPSPKQTPKQAKPAASKSAGKSPQVEALSLSRSQRAGRRMRLRRSRRSMVRRSSRMPPRRISWWANSASYTASTRRRSHRVVSGGITPHGCRSRFWRASRRRGAMSWRLRNNCGR